VGVKYIQSFQAAINISGGFFWLFLTPSDIFLLPSLLLHPLIPTFLRPFLETSSTFPAMLQFYHMTTDDYYFWLPTELVGVELKAGAYLEDSSSV
jgi:hypothetical protein